ncbi:MAG: COX15/CtaA family protein [Ignavibacteriales bacterium]|nr:COX15/CtaA family protein [Ignavibacteriales bacterium]
MYHKVLHRYTVFTVCCTFFLLIAGGMVTSTGSGLAVPDWPLSYGQLMPPMVGGIFYEHGHRMIASFVGFLTVIMTIWFVRVEKRPWVRKLAIFALVAVIIQGLLGGLTVKMMLPPEISATHATLAQLFFCTVSALALFTSKWWLEKEGRANGNETVIPSSGLFATASVVVLIQLILGAIMRHTHSGLAVPDFPLAYGQVFPSLTPERVAEYNSFLIQSDIRLHADGPITAGQISIHVLHRYWALVVTCFLILTSMKLWKLGTIDRLYRRLSMGILACLGGQIALGVYVVLSRKSEVIATAHQSLGALLLMVSVLSFLCIMRVRSKSGSIYGGSLLREAFLQENFY